MFTDALQIALRPLLFLFSWMTDILVRSGAFPIWIALFAATIVSRLFIRPLIGDRISNEVKSINSKSAKSNKSEGD